MTDTLVKAPTLPRLRRRSLPPPACGGRVIAAARLHPLPRSGEGWRGDCFRSPPGEHRTALFHEGGAAFGVVGAGKALVDDALAERHVARGLVLQGLADDLLGGADGQGRVGR